MGKNLVSTLIPILFISTSLAQIKVNGYLQYQYRVELKVQNTETFTPGTINLKFYGNLNPKVKWEIQLGLKEMNFYKFLKDYYIELVDPLNKISGLELKFGQFKYHWSIERKESSSDRKTIYRSQVVSALVADRDRGLEVIYSGVKNLKLALGFWNGNVVYKDKGKITETIDYTRNMDDSDVKKDITVFASYNYSIKKDDGLIVQVAYLYGSNGKYDISNKTRYAVGFDGYFLNRNLQLRGEFIGGKDDDVKKEGYYVQASYRIFDYLEPVLKYEWWDNDKNTPGKSNWITLGLYSKVLDHVAFRLNYITKIEKDVTEEKNDELSFMIQVKF
ncbi:Phosphate-selective porin O and P [Candidatus Thermokryptus mobilis]|uniref:Phosphate-selective porin O and P n=1 Tax=Candidatus Thermokryptus mobilis TaxID=1643428 RepID=A0A0S4N3H7_9BACT|nr:porin [Candidatus Thermokryptus mobilis]CUU04758.1 Phosphate-selective porin O and P [Candidatus Thermokryptus mobilis]